MAEQEEILVEYDDAAKLPHEETKKTVVASSSQIKQ
jgi:hypothetical protein